MYACVSVGGGIGDLSEERKNATLTGSTHGVTLIVQCQYGQAETTYPETPTPDGLFLTVAIIVQEPRRNKDITRTLIKGHNENTDPCFQLMLPMLAFPLFRHLLHVPNTSGGAKTP